MCVCALYRYTMVCLCLKLFWIYIYIHIANKMWLRYQQVVVGRTSKRSDSHLEIDV